MKLDVAKESPLREKSEKIGMPFASVLQAYVIEHLLRTITRSDYKDVLWLLDAGVIGREAYERGTAGRLDFIYMESSRRMARYTPDEVQMFLEVLSGKMVEEFFPEENRAGIEWEIQTPTVEDGSVCIHALGKVEEMSVPVVLFIRRLCGEGYVPLKQQMDMLLEPERQITYYLYPLESVFAENFLEIMEKLELIADMRAFAVVDELLQTLSISGHRMIEILEEKAESQPSIRKGKRLEQLKSYRQYDYMRKRWIKYASHHGKDVLWEELMDRLIAFVEPVWMAFCRNEIFLDDWMPELGRFLG